MRSSPTPARKRALSACAARATGAGPAITTALVAAALATALALLSASPAAASPFDRACGTPGSGFVVGPENSLHEFPWIVHGPWLIAMAPGPAYRLARREGTLEFGYRLSPTRDAPCWIAEAIAASASRGWWHWKSGDGFADVHTTGIGRSLYVGRFYCAGVRLKPPRVVRLICRNRPRTISGTFTISDNPYWPGG